MVRICIVALVGLPASGKTTFCKTILKSSIELNLIHMCYDEIFTYLPQNGGVAFKKERRKVLQKVEQIIDYIISNKCPIEDANHSKQSNSEDFIIFCDDNNYYTGMRYEIYKICKEHQLSFGQLYFPIDLEDALSRNSLRGTSTLPTGVIEQMSNRLEEPSQKNQWEKNTFTIRNCFDLKEFQSFLQMSLDNPLKSTCKVKELDNKKLSVIHEIDILLRKRIKELLQGTNGDLSMKAKVLNEKRKSILLDAKKKEISEAHLDKDCFLERLLSE